MSLQIIRVRNILTLIRPLSAKYHKDLKQNSKYQDLNHQNLKHQDLKHQDLKYQDSKQYSSCCKKCCPRKKIRGKKTYKIVMIRHGESEWNQKNLFTGWYDTPLSEKGHREAKRAGKALKDAGYCFDVAFTSVLTRANMTLNYVLKALNQEDMPIIRTWRLNERHYGALTGLNKSETAAKYGEDKVTIWRRSYDIPPPPMTKKHPYYKAIVEDKRYKHDPPKDQFPMYESLKLTLERTLPFWYDHIVPEIKNGFRVIIAAHGNSLRGIVKNIQNLTEEQIMGVNLPTGIPFYFKLGEDMKALPGTKIEFLGDPETVRKAMEAVAKQGKSK